MSTPVRISLDCSCCKKHIYEDAYEKTPESVIQIEGPKAMEERRPAPIIARSKEENSPPKKKAVSFAIDTKLEKKSSISGTNTVTTPKPSSAKQSRLSYLGNVLMHFLWCTCLWPITLGWFAYRKIFSTLPPSSSLSTSAIREEKSEKPEEDFDVWFDAVESI